MPNPWIESYPVRSYHVDPHGLLTLPALANYLQDAAGVHARQLGVSAEQLIEQRLTWFLARLHIVVDERPAWREDVRVETWPSGHDGLFASREFVVHGPRGPVARATSAWMMVHLDRRRPVRLPRFVQELPLADRARPLPDTPDRLPLVDEPDLVRAYAARHDDLDLNDHVNNVVYVTWVQEALAAADLRVPPAEIIVHFRAEAVYGDVVEVQTRAETAGDGHLHRLVRPADDRELARAWTR